MIPFMFFLPASSLFQTSVSLRYFGASSTYLDLRPPSTSGVVCSSTSLDLWGSLFGVALFERPRPLGWFGVVCSRLFEIGKVHAVGNAFILDDIIHGTKTERSVESHNRDMSFALCLVWPQVQLALHGKNIH